MVDRSGGVHASSRRRYGPETVLRFQSPLINLGMPFSGTRHSEIFHRVAMGVAAYHFTVPTRRYTASRLKYAYV